MWYAVTQDFLHGVFKTKNEAIKALSNDEIHPGKSCGGYELVVPGGADDTNYCYFIAQEDVMRRNGFDHFVDAYKWALENIHFGHVNNGMSCLTWFGDGLELSHPSLFPVGCEPQFEDFVDRTEAHKERLSLALLIANAKVEFDAKVVAQTVAQADQDKPFQWPSTAVLDAICDQSLAGLMQIASLTANKRLKEEEKS